jgi:hypothetical protein
MADRCLLTTWGEVARGREERAMECFNECVGYYGRAQQEGRIEKFDTVLCLPNGRLDGYFKVEATAQQLADMKEDREFQRLMAEAGTIVDGLAITDAVCNQGVADQMEIFREAIAKVPQMA